MKILSKGYLEIERLLLLDTTQDSLLNRLVAQYATLLFAPTYNEKLVGGNGTNVI